MFVVPKAPCASSRARFPTMTLPFTSFFETAFWALAEAAGLEADLVAPLTFAPDFPLATLRRGACFGFAAAAAVFLGGIGPGFLWGASGMDVE